MGGTNIAAYAVRMADVVRHLRTGDENGVAAAADILGSELTVLTEEWAREKFDLTPREALRHMVSGVNDDGLDIRKDYLHDFLYIDLFDVLVRYHGRPLGGWDSIRPSWFGRADHALSEAGIDFSISALVHRGITEIPAQSYDSAVGCLPYDEIPEIYALLAGLRRGDLPLELMHYVADVRDWLKQCLDQHRDLVCVAGGRPIGPVAPGRRRLFPDERPAGTWQQHVDEQLIARGPFRHAAIFGLDGRQWAASAGFEVGAAELAALEAPLADPRVPLPGGVRIAGRVYSAESPERGRITGSDRSCHLTIQRTSKAVLILLEAKRKPLEDAGEVEEQLIDFLETYG
ncbi:profilin [Nocardia sp. BMG111209]|uniref:profilin n=1 Tax=Nocardia sp. BMG111209 TaxID=1160137 RepID=UPI000560952F|nr:profilin [Nocardia sp. BMG111209]